MTRIVFNGREYAGREAMPEDVRRAYDEALAMLRKAHPETADAAGVGGDRAVVSVERSTSFSFTGADGEPLPPLLRRMVESALNADRGRPAERPGPEPDRLQTGMGMLLAFAAGFVIVFGVVLMIAIGGGRAHLAERLAVAAASLLFLGWLDSMAGRLARRREPLLAPDTPGYRRFVLWSAAGLAAAAALLLGTAWYLP